MPRERPDKSFQRGPPRPGQVELLSELLLEPRTMPTVTASKIGRTMPELLAGDHHASQKRYNEQDELEGTQSAAKTLPVADAMNAVRNAVAVCKPVAARRMLAWIIKTRQQHQQMSDFRQGRHPYFSEKCRHSPTVSGRRTRGRDEHQSGGKAVLHATPVRNATPAIVMLRRVFANCEPAKIPFR